MDRFVKAALTASVFLLFCSCSSDDSSGKSQSVQPRELRIQPKNDTEEAPEPKEEQPDVREQNKAYEQAIKGWQERQKTLQSEQNNKDKLNYTTTNPIIIMDKKELQTIKKEAAAGNPEMQYKMGMCYKYGLGVKSDKNKALYWFKKAADKGHMKAKRVYLFLLTR